MAKAYVNFFGDMDAGGYERGAQAFQGVASQVHRQDADVGASAAAPTSVALTASGPDETVYAEIKATSGSIFACILNGDANEAARTAGRVRIDEGEKIVLARNRLVATPTLYLWAV